MKTWRLMMLCGVSVAMASEYPKVDAAVLEYDVHASKLSEFTPTTDARPDPAWIADRLRKMVAVDQYTRRFSMRDWKALGYSPAEILALNERMGKRLMSVDANNTEQLKRLLGKRPWFTISEFGADADNNAWLLVQHADAQPDFQREIVGRLESLAAQGETKPSNFAYLFDRVASSNSDVAQRKPQRYGTQGECTGPGTWEPHPVEDPESLDERRRSVGLMPMAEYQKLFKDVCH